MFKLLLVFLVGCTPFTPVKDMECSQAEQEMFLVCVSSGCNAEYTQDLKDEDACSVEAGGSVVSVKGGSECAFTATGSCYVLCDCPEGVEATYTIEEVPDFEGDSPDDCSNGADDDKDGFFDCADSDCYGAPICQEPVEEDTGEIPLSEDTGIPEEEVVEDSYDYDRDGYTADDCNDRNSAINPEATDIVGDSIDQNCDGVDGLDMDGDGFASASSGGTDCNDYDLLINPDFGMLDVHDFIDSNCDGVDGLSDDYKALRFDFIPGESHTGDFDGDGKDDLIIETWDGDINHALFYGSTLAVSTGYLTLEDADVVIHFLDGANLIVSDLDEDGFDDILCSSDNSFYVFKGTTISGTDDLIPDYNHDAKFYNATGTSALSGSLSFIKIANDWNSDGSKELIIGNGIQNFTFEVRSSWGDNVVSYSLPSSRRILGSALEAGDSDSDGYIDYFSICYSSSIGRPCLRDYNTPTSSWLQLYYTFNPTHRMEDTDGDGYPEVGNGSCFQNVNSISDDTTCDVYWSFAIYDRPFYFDSDSVIDRVYGYTITLSSTGQYVEYESGLYTFGDYDGDGQTEIVTSTGIVGIH